MIRRLSRVALGSALALLVVASAAVAEPPPSSVAGGTIAVQASADGTLLVVTDPPRQAMAVYRVDGNTVKLLDVRRLDRDFAEERAKDTPPAPTGPPAKDVPGQDPPSFVRTPKAVRLSSQYNADWAPGERWYATYAVPGAVDEVYTAIRGRYKDWKAVTESSDSDRSSFKVSNDNRKMDVNLTVYRRAPGFVFVEVAEERRRD